MTQSQILTLKCDGGEGGEGGDDDHLWWVQHVTSIPTHKLCQGQFENYCSGIVVMWGEYGHR
jgi:hypothetical protein